MPARVRCPNGQIGHSPINTALDNATFVTAINCILGGTAPLFQGKVGKPIVVPKRSGSER